MNNILIIEDDVFQRTVLHKQLTKLTDCEIQLSGDGEEALNLLEVAEPDVIFCDLNLPGLDGVEIIRFIAQKKISSSLVLMSSEANDILSSVKTMSEAYGLLDIHALRKPMRIKEIARVLNEITHVSKSNDNKTKSKFVITDNDIKCAFNNGQLITYYQPQISTCSRKIVSAEALIRWDHPEYGILTPNFFLDKIIDNNLSEELNHLVIKLAIKECKKWHDNGHLISISINVTPSALTQLNFSDYIFSTLKCYQLDADYLTLEVTESELTNDMAKYLDSLNRLRLKGVHTAIDDFGTGNATLMQLITSPFSELKVDMSFIRKMFEDEKHMIAVKTSISLAKALELKIVAEGIEDNKQADFLTDLGCDLLQGYLFSPAVSGQNFINLIASQLVNAEEVNAFA